MQVNECPDCTVTHQRGSMECPTSRIGQTLGERYAVDRLIGIGGMGAVYRAHDLTDGSEVAVKMLFPGQSRNPTAIQRFAREVQTAAQIHHDGIVAILDAGKDEQAVPFFVMEILHGETLASRVRREPLSVAMTIRIAADVLQALAAAHEMGVIHRDLKPENLFLNRDNGRLKVKILDFGIAKRVDESDSNLTRTGEILGTPRFMSPEHVDDLRKVDPRSDLYSLGAILYFSLTGKAPVEGNALPEVLSRVVMGRIERHPKHVRRDVPEWLDQEIAMALAQNPAERRQSAQRMAEPFLAQVVHFHFPVDDEQGHGALELESELSSTMSHSLMGIRRRFSNGSAENAISNAINSKNLSVFGPSSCFAGSRKKRANGILAVLTICALCVVVGVYIGERAPGVSLGADIAAADPSEPEALPADIEKSRPTQSILNMNAVLAGRFVPTFAPQNEEVVIGTYFMETQEVTHTMFVRWLTSRLDLRISGKRILVNDDYILNLSSGEVGIEWVQGEVRLRDMWADRPIVGVTYRGAERYCKSQGRQLPSEAQWEFASRGRQRAYPWGARAPSCQDAVYGRGDGGPCGALGRGSRPVGTSLLDESPEGIQDLAGNVSEWVASDHASLKVVRGGSWRLGNDALSTRYRRIQHGQEAQDDLGFRCVARAGAN